MIAIVNGQLHYIFWNLKKLENSALYESQTLQRKKVPEKKR